MDTQLYIETHGEDILRAKGLSKTEFAEKMGIRKQNVNALFQTKNIITLKKAAEILDIPIDVLVSTSKTTDIEINGYLEINGEMRRIKGKEDLIAVLSEINSLEMH